MVQGVGVRELATRASALVADAPNLDIRPLSGAAGWLRLRVGDHRVIYRPERQDEPAKIRREDGAGWRYVPGEGVWYEDPKTPENVRTVPLPPFAVDVLAEHLARWPAAPVTLPWGRRAVLPHALRHTCAIELVNAGIPERVVMQWLGHVPPV